MLTNTMSPVTADTPKYSPLPDTSNNTPGEALVGKSPVVMSQGVPERPPEPLPETDANLVKSNEGPLICGVVHTYN